MPLAMMRYLHVKCRNSIYPRSDSVNRFPVPDSKVDWGTEWDDYRPVEFTAPFIKGQLWADPELGCPKFNPQWNTVDGKVNRKSYEGIYKVLDSYPLNLFGRTGMRGRGVLGRWGPNHAADPVVTRWKKDKNDRPVLNIETKLPVLQFLAIKRRDSGEWAVPGGMVDPGELVTATLKREFLEEALNTLEKSKAEKVELSERLEGFFNAGKEIYKGYVDDPRNTDNAWMETVAMQFHDESGATVGSLQFAAGDDAAAVRWLDLDKTLPLYASHCEIIGRVAESMKCHW